MELSNFTTKNYLKGATGIHALDLGAKSDLARLKVEVDKIDLDKLKSVPSDLSKLSK